MDYGKVFKGVTDYILKEHGIKLSSKFKFNPNYEVELNKLDTEFFQKSTKRRIGEGRICFQNSIFVWKHI